MLHRSTTAPTTRVRLGRPDIHPDWCGRGHVCSADQAVGQEHRSHPQAVDTDLGRLVLTRIQTLGGAERLQVTAVVDLPGGADEARQAATRLTADLCRVLSGQGVPR